MTKNTSFDMAAFVVLGILFLSCILRKMTSGHSNRLFLLSLGIAMCATGFDIFAVNLDNAQSENIAALYFAHSGYLITHCLSSPLYFLFIVSLTDTWHKLKKNRLFQVVIILPFMVVLAALITNVKTQLVFTVEGGYKRGRLFCILYIVTVFYVLLYIVYIIRYRKLFSLTKIVSVSALIPIGVLAMVIQMIFPNYLIEMFGGAVSMLIVSVGVQRPEDFIDTFTGLMRHSAYADDMKRAALVGKHVNIIMINIGNYSLLQNMVGYDQATEILGKIGDKLRSVNRKIRSRADLYYLDRGRFRMVFPQDSRNKAERAAELVMEKLKHKFTCNGQDINLFPFVVLARYPDEIENFKSLMSFGMNFHENTHYSGKVMPASEVYDQKKLNIVNDIDRIVDRAFKSNNFKVYYQPIYSVEEKKFVSAEALLRLIDDEYGFISPELFIPASEKSGAIHRIGEFVFEEVCKFIAGDDFEQLGLDYIEVNLSVAQCMHGDLANKVISILKKYNVSSDRINLEITETAASYTQKVMTENLEKLSDAGIKFSLDDYGTGYSNMKRVIQLPLEIIKLDKSFVDEINNPRMWVFLNNTVKMMKDMNMKIVVEGVETQEMLDKFSEIKCDYIQGYFFSKPIPKDEFVKFILENKNK